MKRQCALCERDLSALLNVKAEAKHLLDFTHALVIPYDIRIAKRVLRADIQYAAKGILVQ